jgi:hypothetical protein
MEKNIVQFYKYIVDKWICKCKNWHVNYVQPTVYLTWSIALVLVNPIVPFFVYILNCKFIVVKFLRNLLKNEWIFEWIGLKFPCRV